MHISNSSHSIGVVKADIDHTHQPKILVLSHPSNFLLSDCVVGQYEINQVVRILTWIVTYNVMIS